MEEFTRCAYHSREKSKGKIMEDFTQCAYHSRENRKEKSWEDIEEKERMVGRRQDTGSIAKDKKASSMNEAEEA